MKELAKKYNTTTYAIIKQYKIERQMFKADKAFVMVLEWLDIFYTLGLEF